MSSLRRNGRAGRAGAPAGGALLLALLALLCWPVANAEPLAGTPEVRSAFVARVGGVYQLNAEIGYPANDQTAAALRDGVTLSYDLEVSVTRGRRYWLDAQVVAVNLQRELSYHSVSERFVVTDPLNEGDPRSFASLAEALDEIGRVEGWPILVAAQVPPGDNLVNVRASVRRGRLTGTLRVLMFWSDDWLLESEWYSWSLPR
jgi:hypothetical protein